ncbi:MAG: hypothetical protein ABSC71_10275 [Candidatus Acidiferrales bacterium]
MPARCAYCVGTGFCPKCNGTGTDFLAKCVACMGSGKCPECGGNSSADLTELKIPPPSRS